jgi:hypothetical protein
MLSPVLVEPRTVRGVVCHAKPAADPAKLSNRTPGLPPRLVAEAAAGVPEHDPCQFPTQAAHEQHRLSKSEG